MSLSLCRKRRPRDSQSSQASVSSAASTVVFIKEAASHSVDRGARHDRHSNVAAMPAERAEEDEEAMTSRRAKRLRRSEPQQPQSQARPSLPLSLTQSQFESTIHCGKIDKIVLVNFMCHAHYTIDMLPRVNFIVGSNGSGKSAILAALVIGLGARARNTNRSDSLPKLIKNGESSARVEITFWNDGPEAISPELYGDKITVVRTISRSGSAYKIKSVNGHIVSDKYADLERILDMHNIQVINPAFVMNQDSAREFLKEMEPRKNYSLFMKATQLDSIQEKLFKCQYEYQEHKQRLAVMRMKIERDRQIIRELERKHQTLLSFAKLKNEIYKKELEYEWSLVYQAECELQEVQDTLNSTQSDRNKLFTQTQRKNEIENEHKDKINEYTSIINAKKAEYSAKNECCQQIGSRLKVKVNRCLEIRGDIDSYKKRISHLESQINELRKYIDESSNKMGVAELRRQNEEELVTLRRKLQDIKAITASAGRDQEIFFDDKAQKEDAANNIKQQINHLRQTIDNRKNEISSLHSNKKNQLSIYGEQMQQILHEIQRHFNAGKFSKMPFGPIGKFIEVPEAKYRDVVESQLGGLVRAFIVNNGRDRVQLNEILRKFTNERITVITTKFQSRVYDVRSGCVHPPPGTRLLFDVIRCAEPVVMNCLIDQVKIETILLANSKDIAERITMQQQNVPKNLLKVIVLQPGLEYFPDPNYRMYSLKIRSARFIQVNVDARISQLKVEVQHMEHEKQDLQGKLTVCEGEMREVVLRLHEKQTLLQKHKADSARLEQRIAELVDYEYPVSNELDICQKELAELERESGKFEQKLAAKKREYTDAERERTDIELELREHNTKLTAIQQGIRNTESKENELQMQLRSMCDNFQKYQDRLARLEERIKEQEAEKQSKETNVEKLTKAALKRGNRVETQRRPEEILDELKLRKTKLKQGDTMQENPERLEQDIDSRKHTLKADESTLKTSEVYVQQLSHSLKKRLYFIKNFKRHMVTMLQHAFSTVLKKRSFSGTINADHTNQTLEICVIPRDNHINNAVHTTRALSGGERSYTTVAFLISLWSCVDHPFFFLDEYDVFSDEVTRAYMTNLLLFEGKKRANRQFVLLTPQDNTIDASDYIRIHKLAPPNRR